MLLGAEKTLLRRMCEKKCGSARRPHICDPVPIWGKTWPPGLGWAERHVLELDLRRTLERPKGTVVARNSSREQVYID